MIKLLVKSCRHSYIFTDGIKNVSQTLYCLKRNQFLLSCGIVAREMFHGSCCVYKCIMMAAYLTALYGVYQTF